LSNCQLYIITPPVLGDGFTRLLESALDAGDVASVQLRLDKASDDDWKRAIDALMPVVQSRGAAFILNNRPELAQEFDVDGLHLPTDGIDVKKARAMLGEDRIIGAACRDSRHMAMEAGEAGADYVSFYPFFDAKETIGTEILGWWAEMMETPCVAVGGITADNCGDIVRAGADFICVSGAVWEHPGGPDAGVRALLAAIEKAENEKA
jgi:thiamine-phosphate pyrophosphorylase